MSLFAVLAMLAGGAASVADQRDAHGASIEGYGLVAAVPAGWQVRITRGALEASTAALPPLGPWLGTALHRSLGPGDLGLVLFEDAPLPGVPFERSFYRAGAPPRFGAADFGPPPLGGSNPARHSFARRNFREAGRYFDLFAESGTARPGAEALQKLNGLVRSLRIRPGDFYPGVAASARFRSAPGWHSASSPDTPIGPETSSTSVAATVPYHEPVDVFPPVRTLARLPANGVIVYVTLVASNRDPPLVRNAARHSGRVRLRIPVRGCGSFEGVPTAIAVCRLHTLVPRQYTIDGWVLYGRPSPSAAQRIRAQAEVDRLILPRWPLWPTS